MQKYWGPHAVLGCNNNRCGDYFEVSNGGALGHAEVSVHVYPS